MNEVEEIKNRLDVAEVVGGYLQLKQSGRNLKAPCPFHQEKTASFMVSPEKGIWHCFGCSQGGDIFKFVMLMEGLEFRDALEVLAKRAGVELKRQKGSGGDSKVKERLKAANAWAVKYFQASLMKNRDALDYVVRKRRLKRATIQDFQIGYAPESWDGLIKALGKKGFSREEMIKAGLVGQRQNGSGTYDMFRGRVMFTICDAQGNPVGFTGRVLIETEDTGPKYLNTPQTVLYDKSRAIFGFHLAKEAIRSGDEVVLVEGNMDVVASHQAGIKQVVAASGTALTLDQLKALGRLTKNIKLAFDQDAAGLAATERAIELGQKLGLSLKMITISGAKDPDELIQKDPEEWRKAISKAQYVVDYLFDRFAQDYDLSTATGKRQYSDRLALNLQRLADPVEQDHYIKLLARKMDASPEQVKAKVDAAKPDFRPVTRPVRPPQAEGEVRAVKTDKIPPKDAQTKIEEAVLAINLAYPEARLSLDDLSPGTFSSPDYGEIFKALKAAEKASSDQIAQGLPKLSDYVKILTLRGEEEFSSLAPADRSFEAFKLTRRLQILTGQKNQIAITKLLRAAEDQGDTELAHSLLQKYQALIREEN